MAQKNIYHLAYTRDRQIITQAAWFYANTSGIENLLGITLPDVCPVVYYLRDGAVEIWENEESLQCIQSVIRERNMADPSFIVSIAREFKEVQNRYFLPLKENPVLQDAKALQEFAEQFKKYCVHFFYLWTTLLDDQTPEALKHITQEWRETDEYFDIGGTVLTRTLSSLYPDLSEYPNAILDTEIQNPPSRSDLKKRRDHFVYIPGTYQKNETLLEFSKKNPHRVFSKLQENVQKNSVQGQVAQEGKTVRGRAVLVRNTLQSKKVREGDIIISPMTLPEFLPAMKKASAIVTDEGGLLCHAAIVARELKKPCIIGTKIATKIFKNGNRVEVDTERGVVKILQKK